MVNLKSLTKKRRYPYGYFCFLRRIYSKVVFMISAEMIKPIRVQCNILYLGHWIHTENWELRWKSWERETNWVTLIQVSVRVKKFSLISVFLIKKGKYFFVIIHVISFVSIPSMRSVLFVWLVWLLLFSEWKKKIQCEFQSFSVSKICSCQNLERVTSHGSHNQTGFQ